MILFLCGLLNAGLGQDREVEAAARVTSSLIPEMSGIVASRQHPGIFWVHNDSGDSARIFAIRRDASLVKPPWADNYEGIQIQGARNVDWEDIAIDGKTLYISDLGNNGNRRRDLTIYAVTEPNPFTTTSAKVGKAIRVRYPDQTEFPPSGAWRFDCEALFVLRHKLYVISKDRLNRAMPATSATLYRLDSTRTDQVNTLTKVDSAADLGGWVTGADVSSDAKTIAVLTHWPLSRVTLLRASAPGDRFLSRGKWLAQEFIGLKQCEAICFDGTNNLIVGNEQGELFRVGFWH